MRQHTPFAGLFPAVLTPFDSAGELNLARVEPHAELLAHHTDAGFDTLGQLTVTYLTPAHQACQVQLERWMNDCGFDEVTMSARCYLPLQKVRSTSVTLESVDYGG